MTETLTHATTQPQPLAWAQAAGHCPVILSDTRPELARIRELLGIHAGLADPAGKPWPIPADQPQPPHLSLEYGALVGVVRLVGVIRAVVGGVGDGWMPGQLRVTGFEMMHGNAVGSALGREQNERIRPWWRSGTKWGLLLSEAVLLSEPIPMRGSGGVWRLDRIADPHLQSTDGRWWDSAADWALGQWRKARGQ